MSNHQILNPADHGTLRVNVQPGAEFGDALMACLTVPAEFRAVQSHFPIVFRRDIVTGRFSALALFGFEAGENLFLNGAHWDAAYRPAALAIQPFLIGRASADDGLAQVHIDMDHPRISTSGEGTLVFGKDGNPTPYLESVAAMLGNLDHGYQESAGFYSALERHGLLEPLSLDVSLNDGSRHSLVGYHAIAEDALATLDESALGELHAEGQLLPIFMAVASLGQFAQLIARKNARGAGG